MATLFSDNFESGGYTNWTSTATTGVGSTITADATSAYAGSFGSHHVKPTGSNNGNANAIKDFTPSATGTTSMQFRMNIISATISGGALFYAYLRTESPLFNWVVGIRNAAGTNQFIVYARDTSTLSANITLSGYNLIEMVRDTSGANPVNRCYIDGTLAATITDTTAGTVYTPGQARINCFEESWIATGEVYYDDVLVSDVQQAPLPIPPYTMRMNTRTRPRMFTPGNAR